MNARTAAASAAAATTATTITCYWLLSVTARLQEGCGPRQQQHTSSSTRRIGSTNASNGIATRRETEPMTNNNTSSSCIGATARAMQDENYPSKGHMRTIMIMVGKKRWKLQHVRIKHSSEEVTRRQIACLHLLPGLTLLSTHRFSRLKSRKPQKVELKASSVHP